MRGRGPHAAVNKKEKEQKSSFIFKKRSRVLCCSLSTKQPPPRDSGDLPALRRTTLFSSSFPLIVLPPVKPKQPHREPHFLPQFQARSSTLSSGLLLSPITAFESRRLLLLAAEKLFAGSPCFATVLCTGEPPPAVLSCSFFR